MSELKVLSYEGACKYPNANGELSPINNAVRIIDYLRSKSYIVNILNEVK